jgi:hypothetical protein
VELVLFPTFLSGITLSLPPWRLPPWRALLGFELHQNFTVEGFLCFYVVLKLNWRYAACECRTTGQVPWFSVWVQGNWAIVKVHHVRTRWLVDSTSTCTNVAHHQRCRSTRLCTHSNCTEVKSHVLFLVFSSRTTEQEPPSKNFGGIHQVPLIPSKW